jgi:hypothetical protein
MKIIKNLVKSSSRIGCRDGKDNDERNDGGYCCIGSCLIFSLPDDVDIDR